MCSHEVWHWRIDNPFIGPYEMTLCMTKGGNFTLRHDVKPYLGQSEDWIFCVLLVTHTRNVGCNTLSLIVLIIGHHFKHSVDTSIVSPYFLNLCVLVRLHAIWVCAYALLREVTQGDHTIMHWAVTWHG